MKVHRVLCVLALGSASLVERVAATDSRRSSEATSAASDAAAAPTEAPAAATEAPAATSGDTGAAGDRRG